MKGAMIVLVLLSPVAVKGQDTGLAGCFAVWEINSDAPNGRALLTPYLEFVDARAVELVTEDGVVATPVTPAFAVLRTDDPVGLVAHWQLDDQSVHMVLEVTDEELTGLATFQDRNSGALHRAKLVLEPIERR
jgi:hypothetical protein